MLTSVGVNRVCLSGSLGDKGLFRSANIERFSYDLAKIVSVSVRNFFYQPMDEKIKTWLFVFPPKKTLSMEKALFDGQSCCSMTSKRS